MIQYLLLRQIISLHRKVISQTGGAEGIRDSGALNSAVAQPQMTFDGEDLYPSLAEKASALAYSLIQNHPFIDGNKRVAHAAMEVFLVMNQHEIRAEIEEQETVVLQIATGNLKRAEFSTWLKAHLTII